MSPLAPVEYLYGIQAARYDGNDDWQDSRVVEFRITKKTPKRIYYARDWGPSPEIRCVDRQAIESTGEVRPRARHWFEPDCHLYLKPPEITAARTAPRLAELRAAMAAAHPDRGGSDAAFIAARTAYEQAKRHTPTT